VIEISLNDYLNTSNLVYPPNKLSADSPVSTEAILKDLINKDSQSDRKKHMYQGSNYYRNRNDILERTISYKVDGIEKEDYNRSNYRITHNFHKILVDQKTNYLFGKPVKFSSDNQKALDDIKLFLDEEFDNLLINLATSASNKGEAWIHPYINENGELKLIEIPSEQALPVYDTKTQTVLEQFIRYYEIAIVDRNGNEKTRYKVEIWDKEKCTYYMQDEDGNYFFDDSEPINPMFHWYSYNTLNPDTVIPNSWNEIPFICFKNNDQLSTDLENIKELIFHKKEKKLVIKRRQHS
jgi:SPP1 family phage portal protein